MKLSLHTAHAILSNIFKNSPVVNGNKKYFGVYARNDSKNFTIVDCVIEGHTIQRGLENSSFLIEAYSLMLSPGSSQKIGVCEYYEEPSKSNPLTIKNSNDSLLNYVILQNNTNANDSVIVIQRLGNSEEESQKKVYVNANQTLTVYLTKMEVLFSSQLLTKNDEHFPGISVIVK
ncbi:MAG: hypothetical protein QM763_03690 [Agriterribacter sp.]